MNELEMFTRAASHAAAIAVRTGSTEQTYGELLRNSAAVAASLLGVADDDLNEARVAYWLPAGGDYIAVQWGIWRAGGIAVPLNLSSAVPELLYTLEDSQSSTVVTTHQRAERIQPVSSALGLRLLVVDDIVSTSPRPLPVVDQQRRAMILYTSGTTSQPKGVVTTHANIRAQIESLVEAWHWQSSDCIPLFLPLHHVHGIINVMSCALWCGATVDAFPGFDIHALFRQIAADRYTVFMAVPTIYVKLIETLESLPSDDARRIIDGFRRMRLMVSGSAALPASVHEHWTDLTGQKLLERYGMTEIGMALSNPYQGERRPGAVGRPLPGVEVRLKSERGEIVTHEDEPGEIEVRGPCVFTEYWNRPAATAGSFDGDWFRTGDIAVVEKGYYRIMGRKSVDIIKSGGEKLSALEIESALLQHPAVNQCAVVGISDETWGEAVAAAVVLNEGEQLDLPSLKTWCGDQLAPCKIPKRLLVVDQLPRNAMGKVRKPAVQELFISLPSPEGDQ